DALAPTFGGQRDSLRALKVTAYSYTPAWIAGVVNLVPVLGIIGLIVSLYGLYLLYLGLPVLMRCPREKALPYTVVIVLCAIVITAILATLTSCFIGGAAMMGGAHA
ncbi:MAG TPA: YIP1 family protein, partial [Casimicrobiaceae bacterium]